MNLPVACATGRPGGCMPSKPSLPASERSATRGAGPPFRPLVGIAASTWCCTRRSSRCLAKPRRRPSTRLPSSGWRSSMSATPSSSSSCTCALYRAIVGSILLTNASVAAFETSLVLATNAIDVILNNNSSNNNNNSNYAHSLQPQSSRYSSKSANHPRSVPAAAAPASLATSSTRSLTPRSSRPSSAPSSSASCHPSRSPPRRAASTFLLAKQQQCAPSARSTSTSRGACECCSQPCRCSS